MLGQLNIYGMDKVEVSIERFKAFEPEEGYFLAFSGGKDSCVIKALADRPIGECRTCGRNADNGGVHEDGRTKCPIQEHYALLLDGYCHLYEPYDCGAKMERREP